MIDTDGDRAEWNFPAEADAVRTARHAVRETLRAWELDTALGDVTVLLVSELVTNSLRYASGPIGVRLVRTRPGAPTPPTRPRCWWRFPIRFRIRRPSAPRTRGRRGPRPQSGGLLRPPLGHP